MAKHGHDVTVFTTNAGLNGELGIQPCQCTPRNGVSVWYFPAKYILGIWSTEMMRAVRQRLRDFDILHVTGVWQPTSVAACCAATQFNIPYVISPRGALGPYSWRQKRIKKLVYYQLFERRNVKNADGVHYTSLQELNECQRLRLPGKSCIIPNGLDLAHWWRDKSAGSIWRHRNGLNSSDFVLINVGRLHHKKGLDLLPQLLKEIVDLPWRMVFVGIDEDGTGLALRTEFSRFGLLDRVLFINNIPPTELRAVYSGADLFLLPSRHENFGNVIIEAIACECPVLVSEQTGVWDQVKDLPLATGLPRTIAKWREHIANSINKRNSHSPQTADCKQTLQNRFATARTASSMINFYSDIIDLHSRRIKNEAS